jgi:hypothetical protein
MTTIADVFASKARAFIPARVCHSFNIWAKSDMKTKWLSRAVAAFGGLLFFFTAPAALEAQTQVLHDDMPAIVKSLQPAGRLPGTNRLNLAIGLPLRNQAALSNLFQQIYDPASPNYHHYLTPEQFTE